MNCECRFISFGHPFACPLCNAPIAVPLPDACPNCGFAIPVALHSVVMVYLIGEAVDIQMPIFWSRWPTAEQLQRLMDWWRQCEPVDEERFM